MAMRIEVVDAWPQRAEVLELRLPAGATVRDALAASGLKGVQVGIFGKRVTMDTRLADGDRVEVYRPLAIDPKDARRRRVKSKR
jgi:putative ubiquitin-RnfH superfamily antitoxin RatB of RatAB toxin-antitoxin module